ncbi:MAG TPA: hypothetical protein PLZ64_04595 [Chitinophagales bacterium]|nr:hypothetical protein [Chitinophagales bacterium]
MKKLTLPLFAIALFLAGIFIAKGGDNKAAAPAKDAKAEKRKADSLQYANFTTDTKDYTFQNTPNEVVLNNGMKISFIKINRFAIPRGVNVVIPDDISQRWMYELAEVEIKATNTTSAEIKLGATPSEALLVSFKMYGTETASKPFYSQYPLSFGSIYSFMEPAQPEKVTPVFQTTQALVNGNYKPGETKTAKGFIICLAKAAKHIDKIIVNNQEFGTNKFYACPANL